VCAVRGGMYKEWGKRAMSSHPAITRFSAISTTSNSVWQYSSPEADMLQLTEPVVTALFTRVHHRSVTYLKAMQSQFFMAHFKTKHSTFPKIFQVVPFPLGLPPNLFLWSGQRYCMTFASSVRRFLYHAQPSSWSTTLYRPSISTNSTYSTHIAFTCEGSGVKEPAIRR